MAHYAKIENGIVVNVIVADEDVIKTYKGTWIQTSYNTRGGIHYDPKTGEKSKNQSKALRKNYAGIGYTYDKSLDAFIPPRPESDYFDYELDEKTCLWIPKEKTY